MASTASFGLAASAVRPVARARRTATVRAAAGPHRRRSAGVPVPGVSARPGSLLGVTRRGPVRARNVVTNDKDANKDAPLDVVEIEECLSVRDAHRGSPSAASRCLRTTRPILFMSSPNAVATRPLPVRPARALKKDPFAHRSTLRLTTIAG